VDGVRINCELSKNFRRGLQLLPNGRMVQHPHTHQHLMTSQISGQGIAQNYPSPHPHLVPYYPSYGYAYPAPYSAPGPAFFNSNAYDNYDEHSTDGSIAVALALDERD